MMSTSLERLDHGSKTSSDQVSSRFVIHLRQSQVMTDPLLGPPSIPLNYDAPRVGRQTR